MYLHERNAPPDYRIETSKAKDQIPNADWRKTTWIAPEDAHKAPGTKYRTLLACQ